MKFRPPLFLGSAALAALLFSACDRRPDLGTMRVETVQRTLLTNFDEHQVLVEHPDHPVRVAILQSMDRPGLGGIAAPSLELVPPARVRLELGDHTSDSMLRFAVGANQTAYEAPNKGRVRFRVSAGETVLFESEARIGPDVSERDRVWEAVELPIGAYTDLVLETELVGKGDLAPEIGFSGLQLFSTRDVDRGAANDDHPNVVVVVMDTLRADRLSCYGNDRELTPHLDALASEGTLFENAYSTSPWTWPSTASLLTGRPSPAHGLENTDSCFLSFEFLTLAEALQSAGWTTAAFSSNPLVRGEVDFDQGFEEFHEHNFKPTDEFWEEIDAWIARQGERRFFLYLHLVDPHEYRPSDAAAEQWTLPRPESFSRRSWKQLELSRRNNQPYSEQAYDEYLAYHSSIYDATVADADDVMGRLRAALQRNGYNDNTLIAFTSDHGEEFLEHGMLYHTAQLYDESLHVPLILSGAGVPVGERHAARAENRYLAHTLLELVGVEPTENLRGLDLLDADERSDAADEPFFASTHLGRWVRKGDAAPLDEAIIHAVRHLDMLFMWVPEAEDGEILQRLYDLRTDPEALHDISDQQPETCLQMRKLISAWVERCESSRPATLSGGHTSLDLLKRLGYVGDGNDED